VPYCMVDKIQRYTDLFALIAFGQLMWIDIRKLLDHYGIERGLSMFIVAAAKRPD